MPLEVNKSSILNLLYSSEYLSSLTSDFGIVLYATRSFMSAKKLWELLHKEDYVATLGTYTGNMAVQQARAGLKAIYLSGWQVAADANS